MNDKSIAVLSFPIVQTLSAQLIWSHSEKELKAEIEKDIFELGLMVEDDG